MVDLPFMKLFWSDLLMDTSHLSHAEFGLYMRVLGRMWTTNGGHVSETIFDRLADHDSGFLDPDIVRSLLTKTKKGLTQKRLLHEQSTALQRSEMFRKAGKKGGQAKARLKPGTSKLLATSQKEESPLSKKIEVANRENGEDKNVRRKAKQPAKTDIADWRPDGTDYRYAEEHGRDPDRILQDITDWCQNVTRAKRLKPEPRAFWQSWVRRAEDRGEAAAQRGRGKRRRSDEILEAGYRFGTGGDLD